MPLNRKRFVLSMLLIFSNIVGATESAPHHVHALRVTVLSTMLADSGIGEWGFAALVEVDGRRILFDTGARPETVLANAREMRIDLSNVEDVVISHNHSDHTGGLVTLRRELQKQNPNALSRAHVGEGIFLSRLAANGNEANGLLRFKADYEAMGGHFVVHAKPTELFPGVWFTGPVPRIYPEKNYPTGLKLKTVGGDVEDSIPEDSSLVFDTDEGLVVLSGCGHSGIINTVEYARKSVEAVPILAVIGGLHLFGASDEVLAWTAEKLKAVGLRNLLGAHCTGIEATFRIRQLAGLDRKTAVVSAVGSSFTLGKGIDPLGLAK
jgi:7,8-dihydropterin-6-yl-methyl-4-(beta-D-ribofuranosyl)aminobenzene 5'-phosphate synthase